MGVKVSRHCEDQTQRSTGWKQRHPARVSHQAWSASSWAARSHWGAWAPPSRLNGHEPSVPRMAPHTRGAPHCAFSVVHRLHCPVLLPARTRQSHRLTHWAAPSPPTLQPVGSCEWVSCNSCMLLYKLFPHVWSQRTYEYVFTNIRLFLVGISIYSSSKRSVNLAISKHSTKFSIFNFQFYIFERSLSKITHQIHF